MTPEAFLTRFPEFRAAGTLIQAALDEAAAVIDPAVYGTKADIALGLYAAHLITMSPYGRSLRLEGDETKSSYLERFNAITKAVAPSIIVL